MLKKFFFVSKIIIINLFILFLSIVLIELFFGYWFKNELKNKLSSERNIYRIYNTDFKFLKNTSTYIKNNYGFRVENLNEDIHNPDYVFVGGSTINQKFLNFDETVVGILKKNIKNKKIINAGVDGMSIKGNLNSFEMWFDKIDNFNPKFYVFTLGVNDRYMIDTFRFRDFIDNLEEATRSDNLRELIESNSFFITKGRIIKSVLYLKYGINLGINNVKKNHVYIERGKVEFVSFKDREKQYQNLKKEEKIKYENFKTWYFLKLQELTKKTESRNSIPIFINQITGYGHSFESYIIADTILKHCEIYKLKCINVAEEVDFLFDDFYDENHLNQKGSRKMAEYIYKNLN